MSVAWTLICHHKLQTIKLDFPTHTCQKGEMFHAWLHTSVNPNYDDVIKALEAVGERKIAQQLRDKFVTQVHVLFRFSVTLY